MLSFSFDLVSSSLVSVAKSEQNLAGLAISIIPPSKRSSILNSSPVSSSVSGIGLAQFSSSHVLPIINNEINWFQTHKIKECIKNEKENIRHIEGMPKETGLVDACVISPEIFIKYIAKRVSLNEIEIKLLEQEKNKCQ